MPFRAFLAGGLLVVAGIAFLVSPWASSHPDGLERVAIDEGIDGDQRPHALEELPTADYAIRGIDDDRLATGLAGLLGVAATFVVAVGLVTGLRRLRPDPPPAGPTA